MQTVVFWMSVLKAAVREHLGVRGDGQNPRLCTFNVGMEHPY